MYHAEQKYDLILEKTAPGYPGDLQDEQEHLPGMKGNLGHFQYLRRELWSTKHNHWQIPAASPSHGTRWLSSRTSNIEWQQIFHAHTRPCSQQEVK